VRKNVEASMTDLTRRGMMAAAGLAAAACATGPGEEGGGKPMTWLVVHGAWSAGWAWKKMRARLNVDGSQLWTPTMTGVGERVHLAGPQVKLDTHIQDIIGVIETEDLSDITLVAHSSGGMVGMAVADRVGGRVKRLPSCRMTDSRRQTSSARRSGSRRMGACRRGRTRRTPLWRTRPGSIHAACLSLLALSPRR
jgi:triacylglycerol esterase/lipase EstA (alpha/beta hydrolase family)